MNRDETHSSLTGSFKNLFQTDVFHKILSLLSFFNQSRMDRHGLPYANHNSPTDGGQLRALIPRRQRNSGLASLKLFPRTALALLKSLVP